jgi:hypothetical protein
MYSLKQVLEERSQEPDLFQAFEAFCAVQHAGENLEFYFAVEAFKASPAMSPISPPGKSISLFRKLSFTRSPKKPVENPRLKQAEDIFARYLNADAERWVCHEQGISKLLRLDLLESGAPSPTMFDGLQRIIFLEMEKDLLVRFNRSFHLQVR